MDLSDLSTFVIHYHSHNPHYPAPSLSRRHIMEMALHFPVTLTSTFLIRVFHPTGPTNIKLRAGDTPPDIGPYLGGFTP